MAQASAAGSRSKNLVLTAMIFVVSMTFIDQTIVSIAVPEIQRELGLTSTGVQWAVNAYLLSLAALFALGRQEEPADQPGAPGVPTWPRVRTAPPRCRGAGSPDRDVTGGPGSQQAAMTAAANSAGLSRGVKWPDPGRWFSRASA